jgi:hypothetical protein
LFQDTAASRARDECVRMQREELEVFIIFISVELMPQWKEVYNIVPLFTFFVICDKGYKYISLISEEFLQLYMIFKITWFLDLSIVLVFWTEHRVSETEAVSVLR